MIGLLFLPKNFFIVPLILTSKHKNLLKFITIIYSEIFAVRKITDISFLPLTI